MERGELTSSFGEKVLKRKDSKKSNLKTKIGESGGGRKDRHREKYIIFWRKRGVKKRTGGRVQKGLGGGGGKKIRGSWDTKARWLRNRRKAKGI